MKRESETRTELRWFWAWDAAKEERWLESMARQGWHLVSGGILFRFVKGMPAEVRYRLDWRTGTSSTLKEYFDLCRDAGWQRVCSFGSWYYFRTADPSAPELYTDRESLAGRDKRLIALLAILAIPQAASLSAMLSHGGGAPLSTWLYAVQAALLAVLAYAAVRLVLHIRHLKSDPGQL